MKNFRNKNKLNAFGNGSIFSFNELKNEKKVLQRRIQVKQPQLEKVKSREKMYKKFQKSS